MTKLRNVAQQLDEQMGKAAEYLETHPGALEPNLHNIISTINEADRPREDGQIDSWGYYLLTGLLSILWWITGCGMLVVWTHKEIPGNNTYALIGLGLFLITTLLEIGLLIAAKRKGVKP